MGDVADMVLEGILCQQCGVFIDDGGAGFPMSCDDCAAENPEPQAIPAPAAHKVACPICDRSVKKKGLGQHIRAVHPEKQKRR